MPSLMRTRMWYTTETQEKTLSNCRKTKTPPQVPGARPSATTNLCTSSSRPTRTWRTQLSFENGRRCILLIQRTGEERSERSASQAPVREGHSKRQLYLKREQKNFARRWLQVLKTCMSERRTPPNCYTLLAPLGVSRTLPPRRILRSPSRHRCRMSHEAL